MDRLCLTLMVSLVVVAVPACDQLVDISGIRDTTVVLVNTSDDFDVEVQLVYSDEEELISALFSDDNRRRNFTIPPNSSTSFSEHCDDLQAIMIEDADLEIIGAIGPEANTDILVDGEDFGCGDRITFTFDHSAVFTDFRIIVEVDDPGLALGIGGQF